MLPEINLYTQDTDLARKVNAYVATMSSVVHSRNVDEALCRLKPETAALLVVDVCAEQAEQFLQEIKRHHPMTVIIALGTPRSDPILFAENLDVYATDDVNIDRKRFQSLIRRGLDYLDLLEENKNLKEELASSASITQLSHFLNSHQSSKDMYYLRQFTRAFNHCHDKRALVDSIIEGITSSIGVTRVGIFSFSKEFGHYELCGDYKCLEQTSDISFLSSDPLVEYLSSSPHIISHQGLNHVSNSQVRRVLRQNLDVLGAEIIVPLQVKSELIGWLFLGQRVTGQHFREDDLENLMIIGELVSALLYNSLLHEQFGIQSELFDALIDSITFGIIAVSEDEKIRFINGKAMEMLGIPSRLPGNLPLVKLGKLANALRAALHDPEVTSPFTWRDHVKNKEYTVFVQRLERQEHLLGAMALIREGEAESLLDTGDKSVEKGRMLSSKVTHEIKNQLVAINTFIQLLPERYDDPEFRDHFCEIATDEIARIKELISDESEETLVDH